MNLAKRYLIKPGSKVKLARFDTSDNGGLEKEAALPLIEKNVGRLDDLQYLLYAENKRALLVVLQAMDAAGKDGAIRRVMAGFDPLGCHVTSFKVPSEEEREHDFLWRVHQHVPRKGEIAIFNRSHYEDVLVVRVKNFVPKEVWSRRYEQINAFEKHLADNGATIVKFFLHISKAEQKERLQARLDDPVKHHKFNLGDLAERKNWDKYMAAYADALAQCSTPWVPWYVVPADRKWYRNLVISQVLIETLEGLKMQLPKVDFDPQKVRVE